jgi:alcohol dehydrogenase class IV
MWFFRSPTVVFGEEAITHIRELRGKKAFVVTDKFLREKGVITPVLFQLGRAGMDLTLYDNIEPEPSADSIEAGADALEAYAPDWIVAIGGGSVIDAAKAMWVLYENPDIELEAISPLEPITLREKCRMIAVPTTAGTGSEVTWAFVVSMPGDEEGGPRKLGSGHPMAVPDYAVVDPVMSASMPPHVTADTGMDALTQAVEGFLSTWANDFSDGLCLVGARLALQWLPVAVNEADNVEAREKMANAAALAGLGYINSMLGLAHSMGHALGALHKIPHGRAVGICLPYVLDYYADGEPGRCLELTRYLDIPAGDESGAYRALAERVRALATEIGQPLSLRAAGLEHDVYDASIDALVNNAMGDTVIFCSPRQPDEAELRKLFVQVYDGDGEKVL